MDLKEEIPEEVYPLNRWKVSFKRLLGRTRS